MVALIACCYVIWCVACCLSIFYSSLAEVDSRFPLSRAGYLQIWTKEFTNSKFVVTVKEVGVGR